MIVDGIILAVSIFVFGNIEAALFGMIALYVQTKVIDTIIYGGEAGSMATIITSNPDDISDKVIGELDRTATLIQPGECTVSRIQTCFSAQSENLSSAV